MSDYLPFSKSTLLNMQSDVLAALDSAVLEYRQFPKDPHLADRVQQYCSALSDITRAICTRNEEEGAGP